jgi:hypothetical protein
MAFQLQLSEIEKAREVGHRALKAINFREEQERLNVWIALLNLETSYGTEASLDVVFKEAARANDSKTVHWRLAALLDDSQKPEVSHLGFRHREYLRYCSELKSNSGKPAKSLEAVRRYGHYLPNTISSGPCRMKLVNSCPEVF